MTLKYAILSTHGGLPITSFDFQEGGLPIEELLFTGFMSAIQSFITDFKEDKETLQNTGEIKSGNWHILFNKGKLLLGILVGEKLEQEALNKMTKAQFNLEKILLSNNVNQVMVPSDINSEYLSNFSTDLLKNFEREFVQNYFIPTLQKISIDNEPITLISEFWNFISAVDGKRDLISLSTILQSPLEDCRFLAIELFNRKLILFNVDLNESTILKLTIKGTKAILSDQDLSSILTKNWQTLTQPYLSLIDGKMTYSEIKSQLLEKIEFTEDLYKITKQMLFEGVVLPASTNYILGLELQKYYKHFFKKTNNKIGASGLRIFEKHLDIQADIKTIIPSVNKEELDMTRMEVLLGSYGIEQMQDFVIKYLKPMQESLNEYEIKFGSGVSQSLKSEMTKYRLRQFNSLILEFQLSSIIG